MILYLIPHKLSPICILVKVFTILNKRYLNTISTIITRNVVYSYVNCKDDD